MLILTFITFVISACPLPCICGPLTNGEAFHCSEYIDCTSSTSSQSVLSIPFPVSDHFKDGSVGPQCRRLRR